MSVEILQQQYKKIIKQKEELICQLELKYNNYICTLLQQKLLITVQINRKYEELINNINHSIYNKISTNMNDFIGLSNNLTHLSNDSTQNAEQTPELLMTDHINKTQTKIDSNNTTSQNIHVNLPSIEDIKTSQSLLNCDQDVNNSFRRLGFKNSVAANPVHCFLRKHECVECNTSFSCQKNLTQHMKNIHETVFNCTDCNKYIFKCKDCNKHIQKIYPFKCDNCNKLFPNIGRKIGLDENLDSDTESSDYTSDSSKEISKQNVKKHQKKKKKNIKKKN
eukprot:538317_1